MCLKTTAQSVLSILYRDAKLWLRPYLYAPGEAFGYLALTAVLAIFPHRRNNSFRKLVTFLIIVTWIGITSAVALNIASINPWIWGAVTGFTMLVWGQMWEFEKYRVSIGPLELLHEGDDNE